MQPVDQRLIEREFPQEPGLVYLNHAAVAPWPARTAAAVEAFARENVRLGASRYAAWTAKERELREQLKRLINAPSADDIALLKNTSEGISLVSEGLDWREGDNVVSSDEEFPSNRIPWQAQARRGVGFREVGLKVADPEAALMAACDGRTRVLTISSVEFASGLKLDLGRLGRYCRGRGILFCVDAIQSLGAAPLDADAAQADFIMADGHKWMLGPEGIALFYCRAALREQLSLRQYGWHMVDDPGDYDARGWKPAATATRFECGSNNLLGIHALSASLSLLEEIGMARIEQTLAAKTGRLIEGLASLDRVSIISPREAGRRAGIVSFRVEGRDPAGLHRQLVARKVICASRGGGIRFSPHFYVADEKLDRAVEIVKEQIGKSRD